MNKTAANAAQLAKKACAFCFKLSWHNSIFGYKLRTIEAENP